MGQWPRWARAAGLDQEVSTIGNRPDQRPDTNAEERIVRLQEALKRRFRAAGHGSIQRLERALDLGVGYFKDQRRPDRRRIDLRVLFRALDELEVDPADFFADALGSVDPLTVFMTQARALGRKGKPPRILELERRRSGGGAGVADLSALDALLPAEPKLVLRRAHGLVERVADRQLPELLGIYASACRLLGRLDDAQVVLARALERVARSDGSPSGVPRLRGSAVHGDLRRRASQIAAGRGDRRGALALSEQATLAFVSCGDLAAAGKTLADRETWLGDPGRFRRAIRVFERRAASC